MDNHAPMSLGISSNCPVVAPVNDAGEGCQCACMLGWDLHSTLYHFGELLAVGFVQIMVVDIYTWHNISLIAIQLNSEICPLLVLLLWYTWFTMADIPTVTSLQVDTLVETN
jgi:hypothetical protein